MTLEELFERCETNRVVTPFVRNHGRFFAPQPFPKKYRRGRPMVCFANAYRMTIRHKLTYVEGYAIGTTGRSHLHAWCVDADGRVLDPTWGTAKLFRIPFQTRYLRSVINERRKRQGEEAYFGLLDDWQARHPLINDLGQQPDRWLASS